MKKTNNKMNFLSYPVFVLMAFLAVMIFTATSIEGSYCDSMTDSFKKKQCRCNLIDDTQQREECLQDLIDRADEEAKTYKKIIELKRKQQTTLDGQISTLDSEIGEIESDINANKFKINDYNEKIRAVERNMQKKEKMIEAQKKVLAGMIRAYSEHNQDDNLIASILNNEGLSSFMIKKDRIVQTGDNVKSILGSLKALKNNLKKEQALLESQKTKLIDLHYELEEKGSYLESNQRQKKTLLSQTQGEESKYKKLLERVEKQKQQLLGDIDELYSANSEEISALAKSLKKPTSGLASRSWYYSQKDSRWGSSRIGQSSSLLKDYGCAITSVAMAFTYHGESISPKTLAKQPIFYWDLIKWPVTWRSLKLVENTNHSGVSWSKIDKELDKENPVIVFIRAGSKGGHYIVIHHKKKGKYIVHDPYWGANIYLDSSMKLLSKLYGVSISKSSIDQMVLYK